MRIASWNVNSIKARLPTVIEVLDAINCDVVCLQELKCQTEAFPYLEIESLGWNVLVHGQKTYNGVAILSKHPLEEVQRGLPDDPQPEQSRYLEALVEAPTPMRVASIYLPNGNPISGPKAKLEYKHAWMNALLAYMDAAMRDEEAIAFTGDYNVIPQDMDSWDPAHWEGDAATLPETRALYRRMLNLGLTDAFLACDGRANQYTFWDYQAGAWQKDHGIRIDHVLCTPEASDRLKAVEVYRKARGLTKPSDHVPIIAEFE